MHYGRGKVLHSPQTTLNWTLTVFYGHKQTSPYVFFKTRVLIWQVLKCCFKACVRAYFLYVSAINLEKTVSHGLSKVESGPEQKLGQVGKIGSLKVVPSTKNGPDFSTAPARVCRLHQIPVVSFTTALCWFHQLLSFYNTCKCAFRNAHPIYFGQGISDASLYCVANQFN